MRASWKPFYWEPVEGTGERLMAGIVLNFDGQWGAYRMLRNDVLDSLYGKASADPRRLIDEALQMCLAVAVAAGEDGLDSLHPVMGLHPGNSRTTDALSVADAIRQAVLLQSSLAQLDGWDELEESDTPGPEEVNKRFTTEVRDAVLAIRPTLATYFGRTALLTHGGRPVKFGYLSEKMVLHFSVLHPVRQAASVRDARARLWELSLARSMAQLEIAALITAIPRNDELTLGRKQLEELAHKRVEIELEARDANLDVIAVTSASEAASKIVEMA